MSSFINSKYLKLQITGRIKGTNWFETQCIFSATELARYHETDKEKLKPDILGGLSQGHSKPRVTFVLNGNCLKISQVSFCLLHPTTNQTIDWKVN